MSMSATPVAPSVAPLLEAGKASVETCELEELHNKAGSVTDGNAGGNTDATEAPDTVELEVAATVAEADSFFFFVAVDSGL